MQIFHNILFWVPGFFPVVLAIPSVTSYNTQLSADTSDCAIAPTVFTDYPSEFWIQVVFLKPIPDLSGQRKGYPLYVNPDVNPYTSTRDPRACFSESPFIDILVIARKDQFTSQITQLFELRDQILFEQETFAALLWPDEAPTTLFEGFTPFGFNTDPPSQLPVTSLDFRIVKVCTPTGETELQLRVKKYTGNPNERMLSLFFLFDFRFLSSGHDRATDFADLIFLNLPCAVLPADLQIYAGLDTRNNRPSNPVYNQVTIYAKKLNCVYPLIFPLYFYIYRDRIY